MKRLKDNERGMVIVEATFVFPIMFFILFFLIYMGNAYYQKSKIDSCVTKYALEGAAYCADPLVKIGNGASSIPKKNSDIKPYRFWGSMGDATDQVKNNLKKEIGGVGFFAGMEPHLKKCEAKYNNHLLYSTFSVEVEYVIEFPIKFIGSDEVQLLRLNSQDEVPVTDVAEFIRNTDMAIDYLEQNESIQKAMAKAKEFLSKVGGVNE